MAENKNNPTDYSKRVHIVIKYTANLIKYIESNDFLAETHRARLKTEVARMKLYLSELTKLNTDHRREMINLYKNNHAMLGLKSK